MNVVTDELFLIGSAWAPPLWMKTTKDFGSEGELLPKYYQTWADYHLRYSKLIFFIMIGNC